jgi:uncharacterized protein (DUF1501 family)
MKISRRGFLTSSGLAMVSFGFAPGFLARALAEPKRPKKILITLFQRGGADGLSIVPPVGDPQYYALRPNLALPRPGKSDQAALHLDDNFGLHPALAPMKRFWDDGSLAVIHAVGSPKPTRSHFDAQDFMEAGMPGARLPDGWLNRTMQVSPLQGGGSFRAVALQPTLPRSLFGPAPAMAMGSLADFRLMAGKFSAVAERSFESLYSGAVDAVLRHSGGEASEALRTLEISKVEELPPEHGAEYPSSPLGKRLADIARIIRADLGLEIAATDCGGWDTHVGQGNAEGQLANRLKDLSQSIAAFATDLGDRMADICLVTMTEFGRTVRENGNRGTDHGTGSVMMVLGGAVRGRRTLGHWRELKDANLFEGRDVPATTDFRTVLAEVLASHLGISRLEAVFPGFSPASERLALFA